MRYFIVLFNCLLLICTFSEVAAGPPSPPESKAPSFQILQQILEEDPAALTPLNTAELSAIEGLGPFFLSNIVNRVVTQSSYRQARYQNFFRWVGLVGARADQGQITGNRRHICTSCASLKANSSPSITIPPPKITAPAIAPPTRSAGSISIGSVYHSFSSFGSTLTNGRRGHVSSPAPQTAFLSPAPVKRITIDIEGGYIRLKVRSKSITLGNGSHLITSNSSGRIRVESFPAR